MSASYSPYFRSPPSDPSRATSPEAQRRNSSRIPTKSSTSGEKRSVATQHVSKLAKRTSRSVTPLEKPAKDDRVSPRSRAQAPVETPVACSIPHSAMPRGLPSNTSSELRTTYSQHTPSSRYTSLQPPPAIRTPSLVSGSSASTYDSPRSQGLRRKPSNIDRNAPRKYAQTEPSDLGRKTMHSRSETQGDDTFDDSVLGISMPTTSRSIIPSDGYSAFSEMDREWQISSPVPTSAQSATPSTRYTDSPFSHAPTPSSASSYSPAVYSASAPTPRPRQQSPSLYQQSFAAQKKAGPRKDFPPVRESSNSSNSTVKGTNARPAERKSKISGNDHSVVAPSAPPPVQKKPAGSQIPSRPLVKSNLPKARSAAKSQPEIPPELAHLNVDKPLFERPFPPRRPSRDGIANISDMSEPSSVVQSDLPRLYTSYHKRTPSQDITPISAPSSSPSLRSRLGLSPKRSSKQPSPIDSAISVSPAAKLPGRVTTPEPTEVHNVRRQDSPVVGTGPSPSKSPRFGFLSRKSKGDTAKSTEKPKRQHIKGPAAGTGHEGYGRFGFRGRSSSTASSNGVRSPSTDSAASKISRSFASLKSPGSESSATGLWKGKGVRKLSLGSSKDVSEMDDFLRDRLKPKVLRGSGGSYSTTSTGQDSQPFASQYPSSSSSQDSYPKPQLLPSAMKEGKSSMSGRPLIGERLPSDSSEDGPALRHEADSAAHMPTRQSSRSHMNGSERRLPPIDTTQGRHVSARRIGGTSESGANANETPEEAKEGREGLWLRPQHHGSDSKAASKWNFFNRAHASAQPRGKQRISAEKRDLLNENARKPYAAPHYTMMAPVEPIDLFEVEQLVEEGETSADDTASEGAPANSIVAYDRRHSGLLPSPPPRKSTSGTKSETQSSPDSMEVRRDLSESPELQRAQAAMPQPVPQVISISRSPAQLQSPTECGGSQLTAHKTQQPLRTPELEQGAFDRPADGSFKPPRLSPVGRIPQVVSRRDRDRRLPETSFSRPFARGQPHPNVRPPGTLYNQIRASRELTSPAEDSSQPVSISSTRSDGGPGISCSSNPTAASGTSTNRTSVDMPASGNFFTFPRKGSEISNSGSSGTAGWLAGNATQVEPLQQDDPWTEYNDLLDDMMPQKTPISAGSSMGAPLQYNHMLSEASSPSVPTPLNAINQPPTAKPLAPPPNAGHTVLSIPEQVLRFMQPSLSPLRPHSTISDLVDHYGNYSTSGAPTPNRLSMPSAPRQASSQTKRTSVQDSRSSIASSRHSHASVHPRSTSLPDGHPQNAHAGLRASMYNSRDSQLLNIAEYDKEQNTSQANLRFAALMTSKWLSFGRVLFSAAHNEMRLSDTPRVLVLDGLGSDWSHYVALSYPAATVYNLSASRAEQSDPLPGGSQTSPPNHKHVPHSAISSAFPFPKGFFTAVIFRFPTATSDSAYHACIFECKRVLRPGGHLEVAALDLDLMNMGARARCLVRGLKTRMQQRDATMSLRNLSDSLVRLIGRRGFEDVQRCVVGVPAAGRIPRSQDISSCSSDASTNTSRNLSRKRRSSDKEVNFADLLGDARGSDGDTTTGNDEGITKMVAKVGRWWYSNCYESHLLKNDTSIWSDRALLRECEKQGTSFRMLICYAQKPVQSRRRTVSV
ncbi:hypothetical protein D0862_08898 [Hortaea werneckii]|uniref:Methyltransferase type 11 domain-containing protein n=1 Tax=Hortaea werneckii TaxID=91943 RepID=A0A3M7G0W6_HORWE|nr:hypothetical protein D0862_08898 [Hortaea werneckii]